MKKTCSYLLVLFITSVIMETSAQISPNGGTLSDVKFIEGSWKAQAGDKDVEAAWSAPSGDNIVGYVRVMKDGRANLYELFAFEETSEGLIVSVKHFKPNLIGLEEKEISDRYHFIEAGNDRAVFKKQGDDVRVLYEKRSEDEFVIALGARENGDWVFKDFWNFRKSN